MSAVSVAAAPARNLDQPQARAAGRAAGARVRATPAPGRVLGDPTPLACTLAKAALEVVMGAPSVAMVARWVVPPLRVSLERQGAMARRAGARVPTVSVERVRVCRVNATVAEASVVLSDGHRGRAVAMRLEDRSGKWMATVLDVG